MSMKNPDIIPLDKNLSSLLYLLKVNDIWNYKAYLLFVQWRNSEGTINKLYDNLLRISSNRKFVAIFNDTNDTFRTIDKIFLKVIPPSFT